MAKFSNYLENVLINTVLRNQTYTSPSTVYVSLYKTDPTDADTGTEVNAASYQRQPVTFSAPNNGVTSNASEVVFPVAGESWGSITHIGVRDAASGGNLLFHGVLTTARTIDSGNQLVFLSGQITITLD